MAAGPSATGACRPPNGADVARFHVGDTVIVIVFRHADTLIPDHVETIKEDGTITLPLHRRRLLPSAKPPANCKMKFTTTTFRNIMSA